MHQSKFRYEVSHQKFTYRICFWLPVSIAVALASAAMRTNSSYCMSTRLSEAVSRRFREPAWQELHVRGLWDELRTVAIIRHRIAVVVNEVDVVYRPLLDDERRRFDII
jgi:hypothetical protein